MDCIRNAFSHPVTPTRGASNERFVTERSAPQRAANAALLVSGFAARRTGYAGAGSSPRSSEELRLEGSLVKCAGVEKPLRLRLTSNRHTIVSVRRSPERYDVRVHQMFSQADEKVVSALSRYVVNNDSDAATYLGDFIDGHRGQIESQPKRLRRVAIRTNGRHHDLHAIFKRLNAQYFQRSIKAKITWGVAARRSERRSIMVGSYSVEDRLIRVHPVLDRPEVPVFFVEWIVFHEMLHAKHPIKKVGGRRCFHPPAFLDEEHCFAQREQAQRWQIENLDRLLKG